MYYPKRRGFRNGIRGIFMDAAENIEVRLAEMLSYQMGVPISRIGRRTHLQEDLKMTGDDAEEFMADFFEAFQIDRSAFSFDRFFDPESSWPWELLRRHRTIPLTVQDLLQAIETGQWRDPPCSRVNRTNM
jgi:hypothetical protein